jgi:hypothetical protein
MTRILTLVAVMALPGGLTAQRTLVLERFDADLVVRADGDVDVTETLRPRFQGSWNGIYRVLSLAHQTADGRAERLDIDLTGVTDEAGTELRHETSDEGRWSRRIQIWVPGAEDATRTVVLRYVVHNAIRFFEEDGEPGPMDELYWNVTGNDWEIPIEAASARVLLPPGVLPIQSAGYTGRAGSTGQAVRIEATDGGVAFTAGRSLGPGEGLTVAVGWPAGGVQRPAAISAASRTVRERWPGVLPFLAFFLGFRRWRRVGRDPDARAIVVEHEPPDALTPAEMGTLVDHRAELRDITSTLVDLAVRGFLHVEERETRVLGLFSNKDYVLHLKRPRHDWSGLEEHERLYLEAVFKHEGDPTALAVLEGLVGGLATDAKEEVEAGDGPTYGSVPLSALKNEFYKDLPAVRKAIYRQLVGKGHYDRDPESAKRGWLIGGGLMLVVGAVGGFRAWEGGALGADPLWIGAGGLASGIVLLVFAHLMPARTVQGARTREGALGFKEFLDRVEEDRYRRMITSPDLFERYLPFAMAFGVEKRWARAFEDIFTTPPRWYSGTSGDFFHPTSFTNDLNAFSSAASSTMSSSPSGSGGGGSSGGGSGGGGGGGF